MTPKNTYISPQKKQKFNQYTVNKKKDIVSNSSIQCISLFSGCGGLDIGAQLANCKVISTLDFDKDCYNTISSNNFFNHSDHILGDIKDMSAKNYSEVLKSNNPEKLILIGGPPCQPFSKAGYWVTHKKRLGSSDPRNMIDQYLRLIDDIKPDGFILENVESILHPKNIDSVHQLEKAIDKLGYEFIRLKVNSADFGIPQKRKRVFFIASKNKIKTELIKTHGNLKECLKNPQLKPYEKVIDWIGCYNKDIYSDGYDSIEGKYCNDLINVPPGKNYIALTEKYGYPNPKFIAGKRYWSFLLKLDPLKPSWTIISSPGHWEGPFHWENRRLRLKELAAIQTFPSDYIFKGSRRSIQKQIGNAVPCLLAKKIVNHLINNI